MSDVGARFDKVRDLIEFWIKQYFLKNFVKDLTVLDNPYTEHITAFLMCCKAPDDESSLLARWLLFTLKCTKLTINSSDADVANIDYALELARDVRSVCESISLGSSDLGILTDGCIEDLKLLNELLRRPIELSNESKHEKEIDKLTMHLHQSFINLAMKIHDSMHISALEKLAGKKLSQSFQSSEISNSNSQYDADTCNRNVLDISQSLIDNDSIDAFDHNDSMDIARNSMHQNHREVENFFKLFEDGGLDKINNNLEGKNEGNKVETNEKIAKNQSTPNKDMVNNEETSSSNNTGKEKVKTDESVNCGKCGKLRINLDKSSIDLHCVGRCLIMVNVNKDNSNKNYNNVDGIDNSKINTKDNIDSANEDVEIRIKNHEDVKQYNKHSLDLDSPVLKLHNHYQNKTDSVDKTQNVVRISEEKDDENISECSANKNNIKENSNNNNISPENQIDVSSLSRKEEEEGGDYIGEVMENNVINQDKNISNINSNYSVCNESLCSNNNSNNNGSKLNEGRIVNAKNGVENIFDNLRRKRIIYVDDEDDDLDKEPSRIKLTKSLPTIKKHCTSTSRGHSNFYNKVRPEIIPMNLGTRRPNRFVSDDSDEVSSTNSIELDGNRFSIFSKKKKKWTEREEIALVLGVRRHGEGKWAEILNCGDFNNRSNVDIKDKWRNMVKSQRNIQIINIIRRKKNALDGGFR